MPTIKPRVTITMTEEQLNRIEDFRFSKRMKNQTQAILSLIEAGFSVLASKDKAKIDYDETVALLMQKYEKLDEHGKDMVDTVLDKELTRSLSSKAKEENKLVQLSAKEAPEHIKPVAAHNDNTSSKQQQLMRNDLDKLNKLNKH